MLVLRDNFHNRTVPVAWNLPGIADGTLRFFLSSWDARVRIIKHFLPSVYEILRARKNRRLLHTAAATVTANGSTECKCGGLVKARAANGWLCWLSECSPEWALRGVLRLLFEWTK